MALAAVQNGHFSWWYWNSCGSNAGKNTFNCTFNIFRSAIKWKDDAKY